MIRNLSVADLALIELLKGTTDAPPAVLQEQRAKGYVRLTSTGPELTARGRSRGKSLKGMEHDLRRMFSGHAGDSPVIKTVAGPAIHGGR
jgi:hypothetical protein